MNETNETTRRRVPRKAVIVLAAVVLLALVYPLLAKVPDWYHDREMAAYAPALYTAPPVSQEISGEAREGCLLMGMALSEVNDDPDACLSAYWTPERLLRSERTWTDWYADQGEPLRCEDEGYVYPPGSDRVCELGYTPYPALPPLDDPWWAAEAVRDPGRTTDPGPMEFVGLEELGRE